MTHHHHYHLYLGDHSSQRLEAFEGRAPSYQKYEDEELLMKLIENRQLQTESELLFHSTDVDHTIKQERDHVSTRNGNREVRWGLEGSGCEPPIQTNHQISHSHYSSKDQAWEGRQWPGHCSFSPHSHSPRRDRWEREMQRWYCCWDRQSQSDREKREWELVYFLMIWEAKQVGIRMLVW